MAATENQTLTATEEKKPASSPKEEGGEGGTPKASRGARGRKGGKPNGEEAPKAEGDKTNSTTSSADESTAPAGKEKKDRGARNGNGARGKEKPSRESKTPREAKGKEKATDTAAAPPAAKVAESVDVRSTSSFPSLLGPLPDADIKLTAWEGPSSGSAPSLAAAPKDLGKWAKGPPPAAVASPHTVARSSPAAAVRRPASPAPAAAPPAATPKPAPTTTTPSSIVSKEATPAAKAPHAANHTATAVLEEAAKRAAPTAAADQSSEWKEAPSAKSKSKGKGSKGAETAAAAQPPAATAAPKPASPSPITAKPGSSTPTDRRKKEAEAAAAAQAARTASLQQRRQELIDKVIAVMTPPAGSTSRAALWRRAADIAHRIGVPRKVVQILFYGELLLSGVVVKDDASPPWWALRRLVSPGERSPQASDPTSADEGLEHLFYVANSVVSRRPAAGTKEADDQEAAALGSGLPFEEDFLAGGLTQKQISKLTSSTLNALVNSGGGSVSIGLTPPNSSGKGGGGNAASSADSLVVRGTALTGKHQEWIRTKVANELRAWFPSVASDHFEVTMVRVVPESADSSTAGGADEGFKEAKRKGAKRGEKEKEKEKEKERVTTNASEEQQVVVEAWIVKSNYPAFERVNKAASKLCLQRRRGANEAMPNEVRHYRLAKGVKVLDVPTQ